MKFAGVSTVLCACAITLVSLASCATVPPKLVVASDAEVDKTWMNAPLGRIQDQAVNVLMHDNDNKPCLDASGNYIKGVRATLTKLIITYSDGSGVVLPLGDLPQLGALQQGLSDDKKITIVYYAGNKHWGELPISCNETVNIDVINLIYLLDKRARSIKQAMAAYDAKFQPSLNDYRRLIASGASLPQEADMDRVQAEGAVRDKKFHEAEDLYGKAVDVAPWWPQGHFDRAMVFDATGDYDLAIVEMKYYLDLVPNAPNARAAQYKIYDWQRKVDEENANILPYLKNTHQQLAGAKK
jgi:hypothetical protein